MAVTHTEAPLNRETSLEELATAPGAPLYVRCNFAIPRLDAATWSLAVDGMVRRPATLDLAALRALPFVERDVLLECAGNGRSLMDPVPAGVAWGLGAVGVARFGGAPLAALLDRCELDPAATQLVFTGADTGVVEGRETAYAFSLERELALADGPLLAWIMNGAPLAPEHGHPVRLVVPGQYGMRSVKWLTRMTATDRPFDGHFRERYRYRGERGVPDGSPVGPIRVRSLILSPRAGDRLGRSAVEVRGIAWSGRGAVRRVEIGIDGQWSETQLEAGSEPARWRLDWTPPGPGSYELAARATDAAGMTQPDAAVWNEGGYGNNVVHRVRVTVD